jgi:transglutaminase-like putative cysteine protease
MFITPIYAEDISVYLNGEKLIFDVAPQNIDNRVMVPFRMIGEALGAKCYWVSEDNTVIMSKQDGMLGLIIGHNKMYFSDGEVVTNNIELDVAPQIDNSRTLVPVRAVSEGFDSSVYWDEKTKSVLITTSDYTPPVSNAETDNPVAASLSEFTNELQKNLDERNTEFTLKATGISTEDMEGVNLSHLSSAVSSWSYHYSVYDGYVEAYYRINYVMAEGIIEAFKSRDTSGLSSQQLEVYNKANSILQSIITKDMGDYEKELKIHDYLALNVSYDYDNYLADTIPDESHTPYGALIKKVAVCDGFAESFRILGTMAGLECETVIGYTEEPHAWNRVKIDGSYYLIDVTFDTPVPNVPGLVLYTYFNLTDSEMGMDHKPDTAGQIKCTDTKYNYFVYNNLLFSSQEEFEQIFSNELKAGKKFISLKSDGIDIEDIEFEFIFELTGKKDISYFEEAGHGILTIVV